MIHPILQILDDHMHSRETSSFDTNWDDILSLSRMHEVVAIVYSQCKSFIPQPYLREFEKAYSTVLFYYANRKQTMSRIENALADIQHFTIKGASVAAFYPFPAFRTMGDTDIVVHIEDREEADRRLRSLGLDCVSSFDDREWQYYYNNMEFELHDHLVYSEAVNVDAQERYFNDFWKHVKGNELDWNFHFLFLILHLRKHFMNSGIGFRQFMDIAVLTSHGPDFNWKWIKEELEKLGLWSFTERVFALNEYWFDITSPVAVSSFPESFLSSATALILKNGVFGFDNDDNKGVASVNNARGDGYSRVSMIRRAIGGFFPSYSTVVKVPHYAYIKEKPWLLPFVWIHRYIRSIVNKRVGQNMKSVATNSFPEREKIEQREAIYKQWGL